MSPSSEVPDTVPPAAPGTFDAERGSAAARKRWAAPPAPTTPEELEVLLGKLDSPAGAQRASAQLVKWGILGKLTSAQVSACAKAVDIYLKALDAELDRQTMTKLERRVKELERELAAERKRHHGVG